MMIFEILTLFNAYTQHLYYLFTLLFIVIKQLLIILFLETLYLRHSCLALGLSRVTFVCVSIDWYMDLITLISNCNNKIDLTIVMRSKTDDDVL